MSDTSLCASSKKLYLPAFERNIELKFFTCSVVKHFSLKYFLASSSIPSSFVREAIFLRNFRKSSLLATMAHFLAVESVLFLLKGHHFTPFSFDSTGSLPSSATLFLPNGHHFFPSSFFTSASFVLLALAVSAGTFAIFLSSLFASVFGHSLHTFR